MLHVIRSLYWGNNWLYAQCTRWFGGVLLGADRFRDITFTVKQLLDAHAAELASPAASKVTR